MKNTDNYNFNLAEGGDFIAVAEHIAKNFEKLDKILYELVVPAIEFETVAAAVETDLKSVCNGAGNAVAVGAAGKIIYSNNHGATWEEIESGTTADLNDVKYLNGHFVVSGNGIVLESVSGMEWETVIEDDSNYVAAEYFAGKYMTISSNGIRKSKDLITWTLDTSLKITPAFLKCANGIIFTADGKTLYYSEDGATWKNVDVAVSTEYNMNDISYVNGLYLTVGNGGNWYTSLDLKTWTTHTAGSNLYEFKTVMELYDFSLIAGNADGNAYRTKSGEGFKTFSISEKIINSMCYEGGYIIAVGKNGTVARTEYMDRNKISEMANDARNDMQNVKKGIALLYDLLNGNATGSKKGIVKLSDVYDSAVASGAAANGLGASQNALYNAYNELNTNLTQIGTSKKLLDFYTENSAGEGINFPIDFTQYRYLFMIFKYDNHVLDSAFIPVSIFIEQCYNSEHPIILNDKIAIITNAEVVAAAEVSCNLTGNNFYVFINQPYYPVVVWGIK